MATNHTTKFKVFFLFFFLLWFRGGYTTKETLGAFLQAGGGIFQPTSSRKMPPGRPPKRPSDGMNSSLDHSFSSKPKLPRVERGSQDFSKAVQNKLQTYTRTGQACDRCKVREYPILYTKQEKEKNRKNTRRTAQHSTAQLLSYPPSLPVGWFPEKRPKLSVLWMGAGK